GAVIPAAARRHDESHPEGYERGQQMDVPRHREPHHELFLLRVCSSIAMATIKARIVKPSTPLVEHPDFGCPEGGGGVVPASGVPVPASGPGPVPPSGGGAMPRTPWIRSQWS